MPHETITADEAATLQALFAKATGCPLFLPPAGRTDYAAFIAEVFAAVAGHHERIRVLGKQYQQARDRDPSLPVSFGYIPSKHFHCKAVGEIITITDKPKGKR